MSIRVKVILYTLILFLKNMGKYLKSFDGTRIYYKCHPGKKPLTLVFLHGIAANWTVWRKEIAYFRRRGYPVIAIDMRGHGKSDFPVEFEKYKTSCFARDVYDILKAEGIRKYMFVGHSLGGAISITYCTCYKKCYPSSLVLVESTIRYPFDHNHILNMHPYITHILRFIAKHKLTKRHFSHLDDIDFSKLGIKTQLHLVYHLLHLTPLRSIVKTLDNIEKYVHKNHRKIDDTVKHLKVPTLLIAGELDDIVPPKYSKRIKELDKKAVLKVMKGAHHRVVIKKPLEISRMIEKFINGDLPS